MVFEKKKFPALILKALNNYLRNFFWSKNVGLVCLKTDISAMNFSQMVKTRYIS